MNRIKIHLPSHFSFQTSLKIRITDLNYGGHVGNDRILSLLQEARQEYLLQFGYGELDFEGLGLIMADVAVEYKSELKYGQTVIISVQAADFDKLGFDLFYKMEIVSETENILAAKAKTGMICYDYQTKKKTNIPEAAILKMSI
ncbi:MAG: thioesterase [Bacteroidetes bacterium 24-39-8]|jgi:YbgC/YbaW family acyl-CoA thioester hydrolase|nr:MAG: thioesterase [Bacteroidetes bacterium 24-39-8]OZA63117.1 MAG: thioesterase [Sphingobacteriia bacterium 39-39-8]HQR91700.1 thioesterase family protein [Sediminibacterium sp.]HQS56085.1 thioesterase family protein [Sediminibacterium sp.]